MGLLRVGLARTLGPRTSLAPDLTVPGSDHDSIRVTYAVRR